MTTSLVPQNSLDREKESITIEVKSNKRANDIDVGAIDLPEPGTPERLEAERKLVRKLDSRLLPTVFIIFVMNYIDRNGITTARLKGMQQDLDISESAFYPGASYLLSRWYTKKPQNTSWMSSYERHLAQARISEDAGEADQDNAEDSYVYSLQTLDWYPLLEYFSPLKGLKMAISDPLVLIFTLQTVSQLLGLSFVNFFPTYAQPT
ncbi:hypothetical protein C0992_004105 [Termitomyces sp. T32_za158]|nr:hypothetical protein C0992_004105 [Termitomyces sp. T32_za158]